MNNPIFDANQKVTKALPAAAATAYSDAIDLRDSAPGVVKMLGKELRVSLPAAPALVEAKTITATLQDSADNSTFAAIPQCATLVQTGAVGNGAAAASRDYALPQSVRRYVRLKLDVLTGGGDNTALSATLEVVQ